VVVPTSWNAPAVKEKVNLAYPRNSGKNSALCFSKSLDKGGWIVVATVTEEQHETSHATSLIPFKMTPVAVRRPRGSILLFRSFRIRFRWVLSWALTIQRQSLGQPLHLLIDL
jgi:hypothetical protein